MVPDESHIVLQYKFCPLLEDSFEARLLQFLKESRGEQPVYLNLYGDVCTIFFITFYRRIGNKEDNNSEIP